MAIHTRDPRTLAGSGSGSSAQASDPMLIIAAQGMSANDLVNVFVDSGTLKIRHADASLGREAFGFIKSDVLLGGYVLMYPPSGYTMSGLALTAATPYYLGDNGGVLASFASASFVQKIGTTLEADHMIVEIGGAYDLSTSSGVSSVGISVPTGLDVSGSPITSAGTIAISLTAGYTIPTSAAITNAATAYGWGNHASAGYLISADIDSLAELNAIVGVTLIEATNPALSDARTPLSHAHGNIANGGTIGSTANLPIITGTAGILQVGAFGTGATDFCVGNDARLADARTPTAHAASHVNGTDDIQDATASQKGLMTAAAMTKLDRITVTQAVDLDQMETDIAALANGMVYKGDWDASGGSFPGAGAAQTGWFYYVSVAGTVDGVAFAIGDNIVATVDGASAATYAANWSKHDQTDAVTTVAGRVGNVVITSSDLADFSTAADARISAAVGVSVQAYNANLTTWASLAPSANAQSLVTAANYPAMRTLLDLEAGVDFYSIAGADAAFQPLDAQLTSLAGLSFAGNSLKAVRLNAGETAFEFFTITGGGDALTSNPLSQFAATTSAQLRGVLNDEIGNGAAVFDNATLVTGLRFPFAGLKIDSTGGGGYVVTHGYNVTSASDHVVTWTVPAGSSSAYTLPASGTLVSDGATLTTGFLFPESGMKVKVTGAIYEITHKYSSSGMINQTVTWAIPSDAAVTYTMPASGSTLLAHSNNLSDVANTATAFANIKQAATTSATGVVELATDGENAADKVVQGNDGRVNDGALTVHMRSTDGATALTAGQVFYCYIPYDCTLSTTADIVSPVSGSAVFDIWEDTYANWPPVVGNTKVTSGKPTLSSATKSQTTVTWVSAALTKGKYLAVKLDSVTTCYELILSIPVTKT